MWPGLARGATRARTICSWIRSWETTAARSLRRLYTATTLACKCGRCRRAGAGCASGGCALTGVYEPDRRATEHACVLPRARELGLGPPRDRRGACRSRFAPSEQVQICLPMRVRPRATTTTTGHQVSGQFFQSGCHTISSKNLSVAAPKAWSGQGTDSNLSPFDAAHVGEMTGMQRVFGSASVRLGNSRPSAPNRLHALPVLALQAARTGRLDHRWRESSKMCVGGGGHVLGTSSSRPLVTRLSQGNRTSRLLYPQSKAFTDGVQRGDEPVK